MSQKVLDYSKYFASVTNRRRVNLIRKLSNIFFATPNAISLASGMPNTETFPFKEITVTYSDSVQHKIENTELAQALQYGSSQGFTPLIEQYRTFQKYWHSPKRNDWDVLITPGSQNGASKVFDMFIDEGQPVMIQAPTYPGIISSVAPLQPDYIEIQQDAHGVIPEEIKTECERRLEKKLPLPKLLYVNPTGANPTGAVLSEERRREVYELAQKYDFIILEDDAYYFLHFMDEYPTSFLSLDTDGRVIRLDSFSKIMSAGIRLGVVTAHKEIIAKLTLHVESTLLHTSSLSQMLMYKLFKSWTSEKFNDHFRTIQAFYRRKRDVMLELIEKHLTGLAEWYVPQGGMFFWIKVNGVNSVYDMVMKNCVKNGVFVLPGNAFNVDPDKPSQYLRICYSYATPEEIDKGLAVVRKAIQEESARVR
ncbi:kynurenine/alpha-aminoadipate aminotransferase, mitochondrial-like [Prorops nasuta]|uniref:kynurenine/alpha-aminoadipate aminotransferase, mitochondrial-like n=1 Tax=Prorops nasuta TaxID=863751 RepID=UPI0034CE48A0